MSKVFKLIVDEDNEPVILEEDEVLEDILIRLESISHRIDDIQYSLIKNNDEASSLDLDISEIDFQSIKKYGVNLTPYYVIIKIQETPSYFKLPLISFLLISSSYFPGSSLSRISTATCNALRYSPFLNKTSAFVSSVFTSKNIER